MYTDFVEMSNKIPRVEFMPNSEISGFMAFDAVTNFFSGADGIPSLSYDTDWFNMLNNLRLETGISYIYMDIVIENILLFLDTLHIIILVSF